MYTIGIYHWHLSRTVLQVFLFLQVQLLGLTLVTPPSDEQVAHSLVIDDQMYCPLQEQEVSFSLPAPLARAVQFTQNELALTVIAINRLEEGQEQTLSIGSHLKLAAQLHATQEVEALVALLEAEHAQHLNEFPVISSAQPLLQVQFIVAAFHTSGVRHAQADALAGPLVQLKFPQFQQLLLARIELASQAHLETFVHVQLAPHPQVVSFTFCPLDLNAAVLQGEQVLLIQIAVLLHTHFCRNRLNTKFDEMQAHVWFTMAPVWLPPLTQAKQVPLSQMEVLEHTHCILVALQTKLEEAHWQVVELTASPVWLVLVRQTTQLLLNQTELLLQTHFNRLALKTQFPDMHQQAVWLMTLPVWLAFLAHTKQLLFIDIELEGHTHDSRMGSNTKFFWHWHSVWLTTAPVWLLFLAQAKQVLLVQIELLVQMHLCNMTSYTKLGEVHSQAVWLMAFPVWLVFC